MEIWIRNQILFVVKLIYRLSKFHLIKTMSLILVRSRSHLIINLLLEECKCALHVLNVSKAKDYLNGLLKLMNVLLIT